MWWRKRNNSWVVEVPGGVVGWMNGGEPIDGCDVVSVMVFAPTETEVRSRVNEIGLWDAYEMDEFGMPDPAGVQAALQDPHRFVWNRADGGDWLPAADLSRR